MTKYLNVVSLALAMLLTLNVSVHGQKKTKLTKKTLTGTAKKLTDPLIPNDPNVKIGRLSNGLTYYIRKNTEPNKRAELYLATRIGSLMEDDDQQGLAHFTEHMAFNGTKDFPKNEMINYLQKAGVRFGADLNAYTGFDQTVYQLPIPTDDEEVFKTGFKILANWAGKVVMDGEEIDNERGVIIEEDRERGKNAEERMSKQLFPLLLKGSRHENRLPIGKLEILKTFAHDRIISFYKDWYRPNLQAVIAVGDFNVNEAEQLIIANFSDLTNPVNPRIRKSYDLPDNKEPLVKIITDPEQTYNVAQIIYKQRSKVATTIAGYRKTLIYAMINTMLSARLQQLLQKGNAPFIFIESSYGAYQEGLVPGINALQTTVVSATGSTLEKAFTAGLAENERVHQFGFLQSELNVVKKNILAGSEKQYKEKDKTPSSAFVQQYLNNFLTGTSIPSIDFLYVQNQKEMGNITLDEVNAQAKTLITKENQIIVVRAPEKEKASLPTQARLIAALNTAGKGITGYVDDVVNKPLLTTKPVAGKIIAESKIDGIGLTEFKLSNGVKVLLKPTDFKNDQIIFTSFSRGGTSLANDQDYKSVQMVNIIPESGVGELNTAQLNKLLAGTTGRGSAYINDLYQGFGGSASWKDLETAFQMVYAYAINPRKDAEFFNKNINDYRVKLANKNTDPGSVFADTIQAVLSSYHNRGMPMTLEDLDQASLDKAFEFYKDRFADAGEQTFVIVGSFDVNSIKPLIETYIASLPASKGTQNFSDNGVRPPNGKISKTVYKGLEDKASVELYIHGDYDFTPDNNMQLAAVKSTLEIKILERLREKESGVYSPKVGLRLTKYPNSHYYFTISFKCSTANVDKLINASLEEVNKIKVNGATADDLRKHKSEQQRQVELGLRDNNFWLNYITSRLKDGGDISQILIYKERLNAVTTESTRAAAQKFLNEDNSIRLVLLPQK
ncbi:M16 family metallopeptidase [Pedobacter psychroterrae]|uniref:Insulinase family protein n=1 Tax=Pedobacter psychroterrae TaxID=2530453 RepID=A0A4R0NPT4_9SPHI|nr:M16 family metallopeptidase [Pedobacter psychroterrae]TCD01245.1 insulinase family protein [Pedobacter psychroterrae]